MSKRLPNGLLFKQDTFARCLAKDMSQKDAAIAAGYSAKNAESIGSKLSRNPKVLAIVAEIKSRAAEKATVDLAYVLGGLKDVADCTRKTIRAVDNDGNEYERPVDASAANKALELLGKHLGAFIDRSQIELSGDVKRIVERLAQIVAEEVTDMEIAERIVVRLSGEIGVGGSANR